jgi:hypothetical protein
MAEPYARATAAVTHPNGLTVWRAPAPERSKTRGATRAAGVRETAYSSGEAASVKPSVRGVSEPTPCSRR